MTTTILVALPLGLVLGGIATWFFLSKSRTPNLSPEARAGRQVYHNIWQTVSDHFYRQNALTRWDAWKNAYDHRIENVADALKFARFMLGTLQDPYTLVRNQDEVEAKNKRQAPSQGDMGISFREEPAGAKELRIESALSEGLQAGDRIIAVDGKDVRALSSEEVNALIKGPFGSLVRITVERAGAMKVLSLRRKTITNTAVKTRRLADDIGYLKLNSFEQVDAARQMRWGLAELTGCRALILDLRNNRGGLLEQAVHCAGLFLKEGLITSTVERIAGQTGYRFKDYVAVENGISIRTWNNVKKGAPEVVVQSRLRGLTKNTPLVILVNYDSASGTELFTAALRDHKRAYVIGERTRGKGVGQLQIKAGHGTEVNVTYLHYLTPTGFWLGDGGSRSPGIQPDLHVRGFNGMVFGSEQDVQLTAACQFLSGQHSGTAA